MAKSFCDKVCDTFLFTLVYFGKPKISLEVFCSFLDLLSSKEEYEIFNGANLIDVVNSIKKSKYLRSFDENSGIIVLDNDRQITDKEFEKHAKEPCFQYLREYINCFDLAMKYRSRNVEFCHVDDDTDGIFDMGSYREMDGSRYDTLIFTDGSVEKVEASSNDRVAVNLEDPDFSVRISNSTFTCYCDAVDSRITNVRFTDKFFNADFIDCILDRLTVGDYCGYEECKDIPHVYKLRRH